MLFTNNTPLPAALIRSSHDDDEMLALILVCATYRFGPAGLELAEEQKPLQLAPDPDYPNDVHFMKDCVSVCASGYVHAPEGEAKRAVAALSVGDARSEVVAFGPRVWGESILAGTLTPTSPRPFTRVPMLWDNAYGGAVWQPAMTIEVEGQDCIVPERDEGYMLNMAGTGFYRDPEAALHQPLPQLEHPDQLIKRWDDRPEPVCFAPYLLRGGLRAASLVRDQKVDFDRLGRVASRSAPRTTFLDIPAGTRIGVEGMRPEKEILAFEVPSSPVAIAVMVGALERRVTPRLDAVDIDAEAGTVRLVYRSGFRYPLVAFDIRRARVEPSGAFPAKSPQG